MESIPAFSTGQYHNILDTDEGWYGGTGRAYRSAKAVATLPNISNKREITFEVSHVLMQWLITYEDARTTENWSNNVINRMTLHSVSYHLICTTSICTALSILTYTKQTAF